MPTVASSVQDWQEACRVKRMALIKKLELLDSARNGMLELTKKQQGEKEKEVMVMMKGPFKGSTFSPIP